MSIKKSISFLIVSALLVLPNGIAKAGDINVHTPGVRVTVGKDGGVNVQSGQTRVVTTPNRLLIPSYRRPPLSTSHRTSTHHPKINQNTGCRGSNYSHQSTYTSGGSQTQTQSSTTSTTVCR